MLNDIKDSIKAKLYDFAYTPFMSSVLISWVVINHKYLLVFFADYDLEKKLALLKGWDFALHTSWVTLPCAMNVFEPILFGLFYVFVYPKISKEFYSYTLERTKELKKIKQDIEDETPIPQEEARKIREDITRLSDEKDDALIKLGKKEEEYKEKLKNAIQPLETKTASLSDRSIKAEQELQQLLKETESLNSELNQANNMLNIKNTQCDELQQKVEELTHQLSAVGIVNATAVISGEQLGLNTPKEDDKAKILRFFYESNYKVKAQDDVLDQIVDITKMVRPKATVILNNLIKEGILRADQYNNIFITDSGNQALLNLFDKSSHQEELN